MKEIVRCLVVLCIAMLCAAVSCDVLRCIVLHCLGLFSFPAPVEVSAMSVLASLVKVEVVLVGLPPGLLMGNPAIMDAQAGNSAGGKGQKKGVRLTPEKEAELHAHWTEVKGKRVVALP